MESLLDAADSTAVARMGARCDCLLGLKPFSWMSLCRWIASIGMRMIGLGTLTCNQPLMLNMMLPMVRCLWQAFQYLACAMETDSKKLDPAAFGVSIHPSSASHMAARKHLTALELHNTSRHAVTRW